MPHLPQFAGQKFVLIGGASQIGAQIAELLLATDLRELVLVDNLQLGSMDNMTSMLADARCRFVRADVLQLQELMLPLVGADGVFMTVALMATSLLKDPQAGLAVNIQGLQNVLEACRLEKVRKIVISSSAGVYGSLLDEPTEEEAPLRWHGLPTGAALYGASKVLGEILARSYKERYGLDYIALRYTAVYGGRQHHRALVGGHMAQCCERILRGERPLLNGDGRQEQDYIHEEDVARANLLAMASDVCNEAINICSGISTSQKRVVDIALRQAGSALEPEFSPAPATGMPAFKARPPMSREKARRLLGWEPRITLEEGVRRMLGR